MPICPDRYNVSPTRTASESGTPAGYTLPEFRNSTLAGSAADAAHAARQPSNPINQLFFMFFAPRQPIDEVHQDFMVQAVTPGMWARQWRSRRQVDCQPHATAGSCALRCWRAARTNPVNNGWPSRGVEVNSGWNCVATNQGWPGSSMISTRSSFE